MSDAVADVLIIGAGPSGGAAAMRFAEAEMSVVCLEQGEWPDRLDYRGGELDWELTSRKQWFYDSNGRGLPQDATVDMSDSEVPILGTFSGVGGSATLFNGVWPRMTPANFRSRSLSGYGDDWPITYDELLPYYEQTDREVGISGLGGNPAYPPGADPPLPPLPIQPGGLRLARAQARLGWHWWPDTNAILSAPYDGRNPCVQRGTCNTGCPEGAKGTSDLTHWRHVVARGGTVITGARVTRIVLDDRGLAAGAEWCDADGVLHMQRANLVVCAANAVGTPRLLFNSASSRFPDGLANGSGLLGRNLMLHLHGIVNGVFEEPLGSWSGHAGSWIGSWEFYESDESRGFVGCGKWQAGPTGGPLMQALPGPGAGVWGPAHHAHVGEHLGHDVYWAVIGEELASEENRVELSGTLTDSSGIPAPKIFYRIADNTRDLLAFHSERAGESLAEAGAVTVDVLPVGLSMSAHLQGTARMGDDPNRSVVDRWGVCHEIPNLAIVDGSIFVTSAGVNPTSTIVALAARTADHLISRRADLPTPEPAATFASASPAREYTSRAITSPVVEPFDVDERVRLAQLADELIPGDGDHPAPSDVGVGAELLDQVVAARPDLAAALHRALEARTASPADWCRELAEHDPEARDALELTVAGGYYMSAAVRDAIGYPGQEARIVQPDTYPEYIDEGLLDHVLSAGEASG